MAATGVSLAFGHPVPVLFLALGLIGHLVVGIHNAWELVAWLATRQ